MLRTFFIISLACLTHLLFSQERPFETFLSDSSMMHASVSLCVADAGTGEVLIEYNSGKSLIPASVLKLVTSAAALELLGPQYTFKTTIGYTGSLNKRSGKLKGNIVIRGGGDPALGSNYFSDHYQDFSGEWTTEIMKLGIKKIKGRVLTDDSYYDFLPVPAKWLLEDAGNYYGAGVYGLSVFDNTYDIYLKSSSIPDPPLLIAKIINEKLKTSGISISKDPATLRSEQENLSEDIVPITETKSPPLSDILIVLNHESVNLYAEHLIKELGKVYKNNGSTAAGVEVIIDFLNDAGIKTDGMFIEDGSGLSPLNAINTKGLVDLLIYMKRNGKYFQDFYSSLPDAGKEGTLKNYFRDPAFDSRVKAKSGSMTRVRSYAGYFTTVSGKNLVFSIIVNNYAGPSQNINSGIEEIIKEIILYK